MGLSILGIGTVSALGCGVETLAAALKGEARPAVEPMLVETAHGPASVPVLTATPDGLERFIAKRSLRRMDKFVRMGLLASFLALEDAGIELGDRTRVGIVFGTGYGPLRTTFEFQETILNDGDKGASPTAFANSVHNAPAAQAAIALGIEGPIQTVTVFGATAAAALRTAEAWLTEGTADLVLVGIGDEFHPLGAYALAEMGADIDGPMAPLDFAHCTWRPGEMFAAFLLGREGEREGNYGRIEATHALDRDYARARGLVSRAGAVVLSATGRRGDYAYESLRLPGQRYAVYTPYYGGSPATPGMDLAAAAVALREGTLYPVPESVRQSHHWNLPREAQPLAGGAGLACAAFAEDGSCSIVSLKKG